jgi:hypothetical protein
MSKKFRNKERELRHLEHEPDHHGAKPGPKVSPLVMVWNAILNYIRSHDNFGVGAPPFNLGGKGKANSIPGGLVSSFIKILSFIFLVLKLNEMIFFSSPSILQITLQGTPLELSTIYDEKRLGNTSFAIQIK